MTFDCSIGYLHFRVLNLLQGSFISNDTIKCCYTLWAVSWCRHTYKYTHNRLLTRNKLHPTQTPPKDKEKPCTTSARRVSSCYRNLWPPVACVAPPIWLAIWVRPAEGSGEEQFISFCLRYVFAGANHQAGFSPPPGSLLAGLNTMTTGKQPIAYRVSWTRPIDHDSWAEENDSSFPGPTCNLRLSLV